MEQSGGRPAGRNFVALGPEDMMSSAGLKGQ
ncbi:unnamed protein product, partial [marine sediment metagenome]